MKNHFIFFLTMFFAGVVVGVFNWLIDAGTVTSIVFCIILGCSSLLLAKVFRFPNIAVMTIAGGVIACLVAWTAFNLGYLFTNN